MRKVYIKIIYDVKVNGKKDRKVDYVQASDFEYALKLFVANHPASRPDVVALVKIQ